MTKSKTKNFLHDKYFLKYMYIYHLCQDKRKLKLFTKATPSVSRGGILLGILGGGVPPGSPNPDAISDQQNVIFHARFQTWPLSRNYVIIT